MNVPARARVARLRRLPAPALAVLTVLALVVPSAVVTAAVTAGSTVAGNRFRATDRVDIGVHGLEVVPDSGRATFRPGDTAQVAFDDTPQGSAAVAADLQPGDVVTFAVTLPSWLTPGSLPGPSDSGGGRVEWERAQDPVDGAWTVTRTSTTATATPSYGPASRIVFPVVAQGVLTSGDVVATVALPEHLASTSPGGSVAVGGISHVDIGVHDLTVTPTDAQRFDEGTEGRVSFRLTPAPAATPRPTHFRAGDVLVHEFTTPAWLTPRDLLVHLPNDRTATVWTSHQNPDGTWTVRRTQEFYVDWTTYNAADLGFGVLATGLPVEGDAVRATTTLPGGLTSNHGTDEVDALAAQRVDVGVYGLEVHPAAGPAFLPTMPGTVRFLTTPGATTVPARLVAGDVITHEVTVPAWLDIVLPDATSRVTWKWTAGQTGTRVVTRTERVVTTRTTYVGSVVDLGVRARKTGLAQGMISVAATLPTGTSSAGRTGSRPVASTASTDVGVHELTVQPDTGDQFAPGDVGTVRFRAIPGSSTSAPFTATTGDTLVHRIVLPVGLSATGLEGATVGRWSTTTWTQSKDGAGAWTVTRTERFDREVDDHLYRAAAYTTIGLPVIASSTLVDGSPVRVTATVPGHLKTSSPEATTAVRGAASVTVGVHTLAVTPVAGTWFQPGAPGTLTFLATPGGHPAAMPVRAGDTVRHTVTLPSGLSLAGALPKPVATGHSTVRWTQTPAGTGPLTRSETFDAALGQYPASSPVQLPVVRSTAPVTGDAVVAVELPAHSLSSRPSASVKVTTSAETLVGVHDLVVQPTGTTSFVSGSTGTASFLTTPSPSTPVAFTVAAGTRRTHTVTLPPWLRPGALPQEPGAQWTQQTLPGGHQVRVTRTVTFASATTTYTTPRLSFPVTVTPGADPSAGVFVTVDVGVPAPLTTLAAHAEAPLSATRHVHDGVYGLKVEPRAGTSTFRPLTWGTITYRAAASTPSTRVLVYLPGEQRVDEITVPAYLTPHLPDPSSTGTSEVTWAAQPAADGATTVTRTERFSATTQLTTNPMISLPVRAAPLLTSTTAPVRVTPRLPRGLASLTSSASYNTKFTNEPVQAGAFGITLDCHGLTLRSVCDFAYDATPGGARVDADLRAGDQIVHSLTGHSGGTIHGWSVGEVRTEDTADYRVTRTAVGLVGGSPTTITRTIEIKRDLRHLQVPRETVRVSFEGDGGQAGALNPQSCFMMHRYVFPESMGVPVHRFWTSPEYPTRSEPEHSLVCAFH